jgi:hypothetical protein
MKKHIALILGTVLTLASPAFGGSGQSPAGKNGGKVVSTGHHQMEIVARDGSLEVYLAHDDGGSEDVKDAKAKATILSEGQKQEIDLVPDPANFLKGAGSFKAIKGTTIIVSLKMPGHKPEQARIKLD